MLILTGLYLASKVANFNPFFFALQAREFFLEGVQLENAGDHFEAIQKYKKAVQLVPDIEYQTFREEQTKQLKHQQQQQQLEGNIF